MILVDFSFNDFFIFFPVDVTDDALLEISRRLYSMDVNGAYDQLELNLQSKTSSGSRVDKAPLPFVFFYLLCLSRYCINYNLYFLIICRLFKNGIPKDILSRPTYAKMLALFDNYLASVNETEQVITT